MDRGEAPDDRFVLHDHVARERRVIGERRTVVDNTIMRHMRVSHQKIVVPDYGLGAIQGPGIEGRVFADRVAVADLEITYTAIEFFVLCKTADHRAGEDLIIFSDRGVPFDRHTRSDLRTRSDPHSPIDDGPRPDLNPLAKDGVRMDDRRRMNLHASTTANFTSASHTSLSPT